MIVLLSAHISFQCLQLNSIKANPVVGKLSRLALVKLLNKLVKPGL